MSIFSDLLRVPINTDLSHKLQENFETKLINNTHDHQIDQLQFYIQQINKLLYDWKSMEDVLLRQSTESLSLISEHMGIVNDVLIFIPEAIKCENYVSLSIYLNQIQSILQERKINIEEKRTDLWEESFQADRNEQDIRERNRYHQYLLGNEMNETKYSINMFDSDDDDDDDENINTAYTPLFQLQIKLVPITSFKRRSESNDQQTPKKLQTFTIYTRMESANLLYGKLKMFTKN